MRDSGKNNFQILYYYITRDLEGNHHLRSHSRYPPPPSISFILSSIKRGQIEDEGYIISICFVISYRFIRHLFL